MGEGVCVCVYGWRIYNLNLAFVDRTFCGPVPNPALHSYRQGELLVCAGGVKWGRTGHGGALLLCFTREAQTRVNGPTQPHPTPGGLLPLNLGREWRYPQPCLDPPGSQHRLAPLEPWPPGAPPSFLSPRLSSLESPAHRLSCPSSPTSLPTPPNVLSPLSIPSTPSHRTSSCVSCVRHVFYLIALIPPPVTPPCRWTDADGSRALFERSRSPDKTMVAVDHMFHVLTKEDGWREVLAQVVGWLDRHVGKVVPGAGGE